MGKETRIIVVEIRIQYKSKDLMLPSNHFKQKIQYNLKYERRVDYIDFLEKIIED